MDPLIWIDGKLFQKSDAKISVYDHGVLYGDGVFEGIRQYHGRVFEKDAHLKRLYESAHGIRLKIPYTPAQLSDALVARTRDQYAERQVRQQIAQDVRQALNSIALASAAIEAATRARDLARRNVDAAQQKYELGTITAFELLDSQSRLATAESALLNAHVGYQQAWISYQRATWTLLDGLGMVLETPPVR